MKSPLNEIMRLLHLPTDIPADELRRIYVLLSSNILSLFTMSAYIIMYFTADGGAFRTLALFLVLCLPLYAVSFFLIRTGRFNAGKVIANCTYTLPLFLSMLIFTGKYPSVQSYFLMFAVIPVLVWSSKQAGYIVMFVALNLACYACSSFLVPAADTRMREVLQNGMVSFNMITTGAAYLTFLLFLILFQHRVNLDEKKLREKAETMEEQMLRFQELSHMDPLTNLLNRRAMMNALREEAARIQRSGGNFCVIICDIDHFKHINDTYGHECGDLTLKQFATLLKNSLRESDKICRWGGEEFCVLMPDTGTEGAGVLAERLRKSIEETTFVCMHRLLSVTVTMGIAAYGAGNDLETTIRLADEAMYAGKREGRNRVSLHAGT